MARVKTTLLVDDRLMRIVRVRAARSGRSQSDVLEDALKEGLGVVQRMRDAAGASEEEALALASSVVHDMRAKGPWRSSRGRKN
jgi:plasmid stability protein